jgi:hypothetical protein
LALFASLSIIANYYLPLSGALAVREVMEHYYLSPSSGWAQFKQQTQLNEEIERKLFSKVNSGELNYMSFVIDQEIYEDKFGSMVILQRVMLDSEDVGENLNSFQVKLDSSKSSHISKVIDSIILKYGLVKTAS